MSHTCETCGQNVAPKPIQPCNLCGHPCGVPPGDNDPGDQEMGLVNVAVSGGYWSTAGNGDGALDDCTSYRFSICEFCLDWLFQRFVIPVARDGCSAAAMDAYRPADQRVSEDDWRREKEKFFAEFEKRNASRKP